MFTGDIHFEGGRAAGPCCAVLHPQGAYCTTVPMPALEAMGFGGGGDSATGAEIRPLQNLLRLWLLRGFSPLQLVQ